MQNGWTLERRQRQAELIKKWKPWEGSTGPRSKNGKARVSLNPYKGGHRKLQRQLARMLRGQREELAEFVNND